MAKEIEVTVDASSQQAEALVGNLKSVPAKWSKWDAGTTYTPLRSVSHNGSGYVCRKACTGVDPEQDVLAGDGVEGSCWILTAKRGKSAYEIAVENGFEGTEADYYEKLKMIPLQASAASVNAKVAEDAAADASAAATRAYDYKGLSEQFAVLAGTHEANALQASIAAQNAQSAAESAKSGSEKAAADAKKATDDAWTAKTAAEKSAEQAASAKSAAATASNSAETARSEAVQAANRAANYADDALDAYNMAESARSASVAASNIASDAKTQAVNAQSGAETARELAESYTNHPPVPGDNGNWQVWDGEKYVDSGKSCAGADSVGVGKAGTGEGAEIFNDIEGNTATGQYSHAEGYNTTADGKFAHAEGSGTVASGKDGHAEGSNTTAEGKASHAEGQGSRAEGDISHAEGFNASAYADFSHSEGYGTYTDGLYSHAEGYHTAAGSECQHVQGRFNIPDYNQKYAHIVGNGEPGTLNASNAHTIDWNGLGWFAGGLKVGGTGQDDPEAKDAVLVPPVSAENKGKAVVVNADGTGFEYGDAPGGGGSATAAPADWLAAEGEKGHVLNRTHHKVVKMEPFEIRAIDFIGDDVVYYDLSAILGERFTITRIKEETLTREQLEGAQVEYSSGNFSGYGDVEYDAEVSELFSSMAGGTVEAYNYYTQRPSVAMDSDYGFIFVFPADLEVPGFGTILKGTYLKPGNNIGLGAEWKFQNVVYSQLEEAYIPPVDVHRFIFPTVDSVDYDDYEVPVNVGGVWNRWQVNDRFINHLKQNKPVQIVLNINDSAHLAVFLLHFPIRGDWSDRSNSLYMEQVTYACDLGVLFIEFKVENSRFTIKVDNLASKLGCITNADIYTGEVEAV